jgi:hypothetical protein
MRAIKMEVLQWLYIPAPRTRAMVDSFWPEDTEGDMMCVSVFGCNADVKGVRISNGGGRG